MDERLERFNPRSMHVALVLSMIFVVASFSASLWYSRFRLERIQQDALEISMNATPAIEHLAAARGELFRVGIGANDFLLSPTKRADAARDEARDARAGLADKLVRYRAIPLLPGEPQVVMPMTDELAHLDAFLAAHVFDRDRASMTEAQREAAFDAMTAARAKVSVSLERLIALNAAVISARTSEIMAARDSARASALALGLLSVAAAIVATLLVLIAMRHQARLVAERRVFLETKALELEAFAGRVAHDLKNPISALLLLVASGQRKLESSDPGVTQLFEKLAQRLKGMNGIVDAFLDFARGAARPHGDARSELRDVVDEVVADVRPLAEEAKTSLRVDEFSPVAVACAPGVLRSVLQNLVQNAVKYIDRGPGEERRIQIHVESCDASVVVEVEDTGPGIPSEKASSIFEPFVRLGASKVQGVGIGLATVKRIVEAHGGRVGVRSAVGLGSRFWFELPRRR